MLFGVAAFVISIGSEGGGSAGEEDGGGEEERLICKDQKGSLQHCTSD